MPMLFRDHSLATYGVSIRMPLDNAIYNGPRFKHLYTPTHLKKVQELDQVSPSEFHKGRKTRRIICQGGGPVTKTNSRKNVNDITPRIYQQWVDSHKYRPVLLNHEFSRNVHPIPWHMGYVNDVFMCPKSRLVYFELVIGQDTYEKLKSDGRPSFVSVKDMSCEVGNENFAIREVSVINNPKGAVHGHKPKRKHSRILLWLDDVDTFKKMASEGKGPDIPESGKPSPMERIGKLWVEKRDSDPNWMKTAELELDDIEPARQFVGEKWNSKDVKERTTARMIAAMLDRLEQKSEEGSAKTSDEDKKRTLTKEEKAHEEKTIRNQGKLLMHEMGINDPSIIDPFCTSMVNQGWTAVRACSMLGALQESLQSVGARVPFGAPPSEKTPSFGAPPATPFKQPSAMAGREMTDEERARTCSFGSPPS